MLENLSEISTKTSLDEFTCGDLVRCAYNLNETDMNVVRLCSGNGGKTVREISEGIEKDRSTTHRSLEKLMACGLCYKERQSGKPRGFVDYYFILPKKEILKKAEGGLDKCYLSIKKMLKEPDAGQLL